MGLGGGGGAPNLSNGHVDGDQGLNPKLFRTFAIFSSGTRGHVKKGRSQPALSGAVAGFPASSTAVFLYSPNMMSMGGNTGGKVSPGKVCRGPFGIF